MTPLAEVALALREPAAAELAALRRRLAEVRLRAGLAPAVGCTFLVIAPSGLPHRSALTATLAALDVRVRWRLTLPGWAGVASAIRVAETAPSPDRLRAALLFEGAWRALFPADRGEAWALASPRDHALLAREKRRIRARMEPLRVDFGLPGMAPRLLTPFHLADPEEAEAEASRLVAAVGQQAQAVGSSAAA